MKLSAKIIGIMIAALLLGFLPAGSWAQPGPPDDDFGMEMGIDLGDPGPPPPGPMGRMGMGMGNEGEGRDMNGPRGGFGRDPMHQREMALEKIKKEDPERYKRIMKIKELAKEYRETESDKRKQEIEKELRPLVDKELRIQQENNKKRVERLEKKLADMKKVLKQREENWDEVVDYTTKEITGQNDYLRAWRGGPMKK